MVGMVPRTSVMVSGSRGTPADSPFLPDWQVMFTLPGDAFNPPSKGEHVVKIRGFDHAL